MSTESLLQKHFFFLILSCIAYYQHGSLLDIEGWPRMLIYGVPAFFLVFFAIEAEKQGYILHRFLIKLGDASYSIYLSHLFIVNAIGMVFMKFWVSGHLFEFTMVVAMITLALLSGFISYKYIEIPIINYAKSFYLNGRFGIQRKLS